VNIFWGDLVFCFSLGLEGMLIFSEEWFRVAWALGELKIPVKDSKDFIVPIMVSIGRSKSEIFG
jgi:hypothetical protein